MKKYFLINKYKPCHTINQKSSNRIIVICDHASKLIPKKYKRLGLNTKEIKSHIGWDIGAASLAKGIALRLDSTLLLTGYSRLIVDCNRALGHPEAFIDKSENTFIPGNHNLSNAEKQIRAKLYCLPYRKKIAKNIDLRLKRKQIPIIISIHSFVPKYKGIKRPWHLSLLYRKDKRLTSLVLKKLKKNKLIKIKINKPYDSEIYNVFTIPFFAESQGFPYLYLEIRQDLLINKKKINNWSRKISKLIKEIIINPKANFILNPSKNILKYYNKKNKII